MYSVFLYSQDVVKFMGIATNLRYAQFVEELSKKVKVNEEEKVWTTFRGDFAGLGICDITVTNAGTYEVDKIIVTKKYVQLNQISEIVELYSRKYGEPTEFTLGGTREYRFKYHAASICISVIDNTYYPAFLYGGVGNTLQIWYQPNIYREKKITTEDI